jgi:hypothetical protein
MYVDNVYLAMAPVQPKHVVYFVRRHGIGGFPVRNHEAALKTMLCIYITLCPRSWALHNAYSCYVCFSNVTCFGVVTIDRFSIGCLDLVTPYTLNSELQEIQRYRWSAYFTHTQYSQSSLVVSWQRFYNILTVTAAHMKSSLHNLILFL